MCDIEIVKQIKRIAKCTATFFNEQCTELLFTDPDNVYFGTLRHLDNQQDVLRLVAKLENLQVLDLRKNKLKFLPDLHTNCLKHLDLGSNHLGTVPTWLKNSRISWLNLGVNDLQEVPTWLGDLPLETIKLHKNQLKSIPDLPETVHVLNLYLNQMTEIPEFIWRLPSIEYLSWGGTGITELPENIGQCISLQWLSFVANQIEHIPDSFGELMNLKGIRLTKNKIKQLPKCPALEEISLYSNLLTDLPEAFYDLPLRKLNLEKNPLSKKTRERVQKTFSHLAGISSQTFFAI